MKCKNPECDNEVIFDKQNNQLRKVFCSNKCCHDFHGKGSKYYVDEDDFKDPEADYSKLITK